MKVFLFILLGFSFFIIGCDGIPEEGVPLEDVFSIGMNSEVPGDNPGETTETTEVTGDGEGGNPVEDLTTELSVSDESGGSSPGPQITGGKDFFADDFRIHEFHSCTKEGAKTYHYELYEGPDDSPYLCYLIHRYKRCGKSYSPEMGGCYENAVTDREFCRNHLEENLDRRRKQGYACEETNKIVWEGGVLTTDEESQNAEGGEPAAAGDGEAASESAQAADAEIVPPEDTAGQPEGGDSGAGGNGEGE